MRVTRALALKLVAVAAVALAAVGYSTSQRTSEVTKLATARSPDGKSEATLEFRVYRGHLTGDPARHEVYIRAVGASDKDAQLAFAAEWPHDQDYKLDWLGPRELRVTLNPHTRVEVQEARVGEVNVRYEMR